MAKRKIGNLKGKPIVEGDPNKLTKNEILYKETDDTIELSIREDNGELKVISGGNTDNSSSKITIRKFFTKFSEPENTTITSYSSLEDAESGNHSVSTLTIDNTVADKKFYPVYTETLQEGAVFQIEKKTIGFVGRPYIKFPNYMGSSTGTVYDPGAWPLYEILDLNQEQKIHQELSDLEYIELSTIVNYVMASADDIKIGEEKEEIGTYAHKVIRENKDIIESRLAQIKEYLISKNVEFGSISDMMFLNVYFDNSNEEGKAKVSIFLQEEKPTANYSSDEYFDRYIVPVVKHCKNNIYRLTNYCSLWDCKVYLD